MRLGIQLPRPPLPRYRKRKEGGQEDGYQVGQAHINREKRRRIAFDEPKSKAPKSVRIRPSTFGSSPPGVVHVSERPGPPTRLP